MKTFQEAHFGLYEKPVDASVAASPGRDESADGG